MDFPTRYDPSGEAEQYRRWEEAGCFRPADDDGRAGVEPTRNCNCLQFREARRVRRCRVCETAEPQPRPYFSIVLPPPNVTGTLHVGHAVMLAIEDMMVRYHRMKGDRTVWIPGVDHAAIATQNVVEKKLKKENVQGRRTRHELGREAFVREVEQFAEQSRDRICTQLRAMGASLDWSRFAYTLDAQRSLAVRTIFTQMYDAGILYRGNRIVNWCPRCKSTLADDEVEYKEEKTPFYYFKYGPVVIGTARPETKFADKTLVVHPDDARYTSLHGTSFDVEWIEGTIQANVIADAVIDPAFGTGAMTITPAHSFEDFELAQKHGLPIVTIIDEDGKLTPAAGSFAGRNAREARAEIVAVLQQKGLVDHIDEHYTHNLSVCYRCETPIEPLPKLQWFVDVNKKFRRNTDDADQRADDADTRIGRRGGAASPPVGGDRGAMIAGGHPPPRDASEGHGGGPPLRSLKDLAIDAVRSGAITILPERFEKEYFHWMENLRDWCISRQIWFGHRIPVWYRGDETYVGVEPPRGDGWEQDPDTLDTWFSAGTWTFSTMGWPQSCHSEEAADEESHAPRNIGAGEISPFGRNDTHAGDLAAFHPTSVLETGYDILFFWIARMILMTEFALGEVPFKQVYLHGLVRDGKGRKMSKSLGNVIDPLDMTQKYGADAVRLALFIGTSPGQDTKLDEQKIAGYAKFVTKLWNIARYVALSCHSEGDPATEESHTPRNIGAGEISPFGRNDIALTIPDHWLLAKRDALVREVTAAYEAHEYSKAAQAAYDFAWHEFADWYIESAKVIAAPHQPTLLRETLEIILQLLHPAMPFVTEELWSRMGHTDMLITAPWPMVGATSPATSVQESDCEAFEFLRELVTAIRQLRNDAKIPPKTMVRLMWNTENERELEWLHDHHVMLIVSRLARVDGWNVPTPDDAPHATVRSTTIHVAPV